MATDGAIVKVLQPIMWWLKWTLMALFEGAAANHVRNMAIV